MILEFLQHLLLDLLDLSFDDTDLFHGAAKPLGLGHDLVHLGEYVSKLGMNLNEGARSRLVGLPGPQRILAELPGLVQQFLDLFFVAQEQGPSSRRR